jgi:ferredoxin
MKMSYRIVIDKPQCVGHARCANIAPDLFKLDDNGFILADAFDVPEGQEINAFRGSRACPERVIKMFDQDGVEVKKSPSPTI